MEEGREGGQGRGRERGVKGKRRWTRDMHLVGVRAQRGQCSMVYCGVGADGSVALNTGGRDGGREAELVLKRARRARKEEGV